jgi:hypothetical protein
MLAVAYLIPEAGVSMLAGSLPGVPECPAASARDLVWVAAAATATDARDATDSARSWALFFSGPTLSRVLAYKLVRCLPKDGDEGPAAWREAARAVLLARRHLPSELALAVLRECRVGAAHESVVDFVKRACGLQSGAGLGPSNLLVAFVLALGPDCDEQERVEIFLRERYRSARARLCGDSRESCNQMSVELEIPDRCLK